MKKLALLTLILISVSCSKEAKIKKIIGESYYGIYRMTKMKEIKKLKEDIASFPIHYTVVQKYVDVESDNDYEVVRYIYKTNKGAHRMFYLINMTQKYIVRKSSDFEDFYAPILRETLGDNAAYLNGDNLMELYRY